MQQHWTLTKNFFEIKEMPFYWRLGKSKNKFENISQYLPVKLEPDNNFDFLKITFNKEEWSIIKKAYKQDATIGFLNQDSGHMETYGSSVNKFFLETVKRFNPVKIYEIGCGAGASIKYLENHGKKVIGIDPSEYSLKFSKELQFELINQFFSNTILDEQADFIFCNDVFEHIPEILNFSKSVFECLEEDGVFCIATTNSTDSIRFGDISMIEHQHVNMFTEISIHQILTSAGFSNIEISKGSYGNTFHIVARKVKEKKNKKRVSTQKVLSLSYFENIKKNLKYFSEIYHSSSVLNCYVPLRCLPYLASVGDFGKTKIFDSNKAWRGSFIDGYSLPIMGPDDICPDKDEKFFIGSLTFYTEIRKLLIQKGVSRNSIFSVLDVKDD